MGWFLRSGKELVKKSSCHDIHSDGSQMSEAVS
jgi:hypothetical protein